MFIRRTACTKKNGSITERFFLCESKRQGSKVVTTTLYPLGKNASIKGAIADMEEHIEKWKKAIKYFSSPEYIASIKRLDDGREYVDTPEGKWVWCCTNDEYIAYGKEELVKLKEKLKLLKKYSEEKVTI